MVNNQVFTIAGAKGGLGKTTTTLNLAAALDQTDCSVVAVEMDLPMPNFVDFLEFEFDPLNDPDLHDVLDGSAGLQEAIYKTPDGLSVVPSVSNMDTYGQTDLSPFPEIIDELRWYFDFIFIDTPAGLSEEAEQSLTAGDQALIVSTPRVASIHNANKTIEFARQQETSIGGLLLNKSSSGASPGLDTIAGAVDVEVLGHVPEDEAVPHAQDLGEPVVTHSPNSAAGIAYKQIAHYFVNPDQSRTSTSATPDDSGSPEYDSTTDDEDIVHKEEDTSGVGSNSTQRKPIEPRRATENDGRGGDENESPANEFIDTPSANGSDVLPDQESEQNSGASDPQESSPQSDTLLRKLRQTFRSD